MFAKQNEVAAERSYIETWRDYWIARAELERAVGGSLSLLVLLLEGNHIQTITMRSYFDHEKLEVYQSELAFIAWLTPLLAKMKQSGAITRTAEIIDQLDRASLSALLNTAEGNGRRQRQTRAKFFDDARGSATECAACLDALVAKALCPTEEVAEGKGSLLRIVSMLTKLIERFDQRLNEEEGIYRTEEEEEDE